VEPGFVVTVEPGVYVIPALIEQWRNENRCADFIRYDKLESLHGFTGIRIEDDVLIEETGNRVLSASIPKEIKELEQVLG
jgi:Xaa-Pro aminopeptidase